MIAQGKKAPEFTLPDANGQEVSLSDYAGKKLLLVFYPGDDTPVCTTQLCSYRDNFSAFTERGVTILGISTNSVESHESFASRNELPFTLLSDSEKKVSEMYGTLNFLGMSERAYVYIDETSTVRLSFNELLPLFYRSTQDLLAQIDSFSNNA